MWISCGCRFRDGHTAPIFLLPLQTLTNSLNIVCATKIEFNLFASIAKNR